MSDIRADLEAAADALESGYATEEEPEILSTDEPAEADSDDGEETDSDQEAPVSDGPEPQQEQAAASVPEDDDPLPTTWSAEMREHWKTTPKRVREYIHRREKQQHEYISRTGHELGKLRKEYNEVENALKPYETHLKEAGVTKGLVITRMIQEREEMTKDPRAFIKRFADSHRLDLLDLAMDADQGEPAEVRQARHEFERQKADVEAQRRQIQAQQREMQQGQVFEYVQAWGAQRPHFAQVRMAMAQVLPEVQQSYAYLSFPEQLDVAYNAVLKHPNFQHLTRSVPESARKAASGISGQTGVPTRQPEPSTIREALMQAAKETGFY